MSPRDPNLSDYASGYACAHRALSRGCSPDWELPASNYKLQPDFARGWNARMRMSRRIHFILRLACYLGSAAATLFVIWLAYCMWVS